MGEEAIWFCVAMFEPEVFRKQTYCIEESTCGIVGTFRRPPQLFGTPIVIPCPGNCAPAAPLVTPLVTATLAPNILLPESQYQGLTVPLVYSVRSCGKRAFLFCHNVLPFVLCHNTTVLSLRWGNAGATRLNYCIR